MQTAKPNVRYRSAEDTAARRQNLAGVAGRQPNGDCQSQESPARSLLHLLGNPESVAELIRSVEEKVPVLWGGASRPIGFVAAALAEARMPVMFNPDLGAFVATLQAMGWRLALSNWGEPQAGDIFVSPDTFQIGFVRKVHARLTAAGQVYSGSFKAVLYDDDRAEQDLSLSEFPHYWLRYG